MKKRFLNSIFAILVAVLLVSCGSSDDYTSSLPSNPMFGVKINIGNLLADSKILDDPQVSGLLNTYADGLPENSKGLLEEIMEDPNASGLDVSKAAYIIFENVEDTKGMALFAVSDSEKLTSILKMVDDKPLESRDGCTTIVEKGETYVAFNDSRLVIAFAKSGTDAVNYITSDNSESRSDAIKQFVASSDDIAMYYDFGAMISLAAMLPETQELSAQADLFAGAKMLGSLNFEPGKMLASTKMYDADALKGLYEKYTKEAEGTYLPLVPENAYGVIQVGWRNLLSSMDHMPESSKAMLQQACQEHGFDMALLDKIDGDVLLSVLPIPEGSITGFPEILFAAKCKDASLFEYVISNVSKIDAGIAKVDENVYRLSSTFAALGFDYCMGYVDETMFVVPGRMLDNVKGGSLKPLEKNFAGTELASKLGMCGMVCNFQALCNGLENSVWNENEYVKLATGVMKEFQDCAIYSEELGEGHFVMDFTDKETNSLKQLVDLVKKQAMAMMLQR